MVGTIENNYVCLQLFPLISYYDKQMNLVESWLVFRQKLMIIEKTHKYRVLKNCPWKSTG